MTNAPKRSHHHNRRHRAWVKSLYQSKSFYTCRSVFGYQDTYFYLLLGGRETGKSYTVMDRFLRDWKLYGKPFYWLRLTDRIAQAMLQNDAAKFIDADLVRRYNLNLKVKGKEVFDQSPDGSLTKLAEVTGISNFYNDKGTATFDNQWHKGYNICLDECQREVGEAVRFDLSYALVNTLENYVRSSKTKVRIAFICNYTETVSDILNLFNFLPEHYGRFHIAARKAVIDYLPPSEAYLVRRKNTVADMLLPDASTFTNKKVFDRSLIVPKTTKLVRPSRIIHFGNPNEIFTVWQGLKDDGTASKVIVAPYYNEKLGADRIIAMKPYIDGLGYIKRNATTIISNWDARNMLFKDLITQQRFVAALAKVRTTK